MTSSTSVLWVFIVGCLLSSARLIFDTPRVAHEAQDTALRSGQRFSDLRDALPKAGVVGYLGESGDFAVGHYYLTQYALAPLVVDHSSEHAIVIGNFPRSQPAAFPKNLKLVRDFGNGVLLFANKDAN
jgi:hypothetical protein